MLASCGSVASWPHLPELSPHPPVGPWGDIQAGVSGPGTRVPRGGFHQHSLHLMKTRDPPLPFLLFSPLRSHTLKHPPVHSPQGSPPSTLASCPQHPYFGDLGPAGFLLGLSSHTTRGPSSCSSPACVLGSPASQASVLTLPWASLWPFLLLCSGRALPTRHEGYILPSGP